MLIQDARHGVVRSLKPIMRMLAFQIQEGLSGVLSRKCCVVATFLPHELCLPVHRTCATYICESAFLCATCFGFSMIMWICTYVFALVCVCHFMDFRLVEDGALAVDYITSTQGPDSRT